MKAYSLLISKDQLVNRTIINDNLDFDYFLPHLMVAQDLDLVQVLGQALFDWLAINVKEDTLSEDDKNLLDDYIAPFLAYASIVFALPTLGVKLVDSGVVQRLADDSQPLTLDDIDKIIDRQAVTRDSYRQRLIDYLYAHADLYPKFKESKTWEQGPDDYNFSMGLGLTDAWAARTGISGTVTEAQINDYITQLKEGTVDNSRQIWVGTEDEFQALTEINEKVLYFRTL